MRFVATIIDRFERKTDTHYVFEPPESISALAVTFLNRAELHPEILNINIIFIYVPNPSIPLVFFSAKIKVTWAQCNTNVV